MMRTIAMVAAVAAQADPEPISKLVLTAVATSLACLAAQDAYEFARDRWWRADDSATAKPHTDSKEETS